MKKFFKNSCKIISFVLSFCIVFAVLQMIFLPKYYDSTKMVKGFYELPENSLDVLFVGPSQMFCTVDSQKLTEEYGISSYDLGSSSQNLTISYYYMQEALKRQKPDVVMVEISAFFNENKNLEERELAWNYVPTKLTPEKIVSLNTVLNGDIKEIVKYGFPLFFTHSNWKRLWIDDVTYYLTTLDYSSRGYIGREHIKEVEIKYLQTEDEKTPRGGVLPETDEAISNITELCRENGIQVVFFKSPAAKWTKSDSQTVRDYMDKNNLIFLEMNDYLAEIGIDGKTDFYDENHLCTEGAEKSTDFIAQYLKEMDSF